jgi:hypothetical protein
MKRSVQILICIIVLALPLISFAEIKKAYRSPDKMTKAIIFTTDNECAESRVEIRKRNGALIVETDYSSPDCEHGLIIERAEWTPDSRFFIFSGNSSGGHQPWQAPTFVFDCRFNDIVEVNEYLPAVADTQFSLKAPDIITINIWTPLTTEKDLDKSIILPVTFRLRDIRKGSKKKQESPEE